MTTVYKLTSADGRSNDDRRWGPGATYTAAGDEDPDDPGWIPAYTHALLAVLLNPVHADYHSPCLWLAEAVIRVEHCGLGVGCTSLTTLERMPLPLARAESMAREALARRNAAWVAEETIDAARAAGDLGRPLPLTEIAAWACGAAA